MSYYVVDVSGRCQGPTGRGCGARAGHEVRGPGNARMGSYCSKCSKIRVRDLDRAEREAQRARLAQREVTRPHAAPPSAASERMARLVPEDDLPLGPDPTGDYGP